MNVRNVWLWALLAVLVAGGLVRAQQESEARTSITGGPDYTASGPGGTVAANDSPGATTGGHHLSSWINFSRPDCCGPIGADGPLMSELYVRTGLTVPIFGGTFAHVLESGWEVKGGGRLLLFDPPSQKAWTVDLSIANIGSHGQHADMVFPLHNIIEAGGTSITGGSSTQLVPLQDVTVQDLNRTYVEALFGREWYLMGSGVSHDGPSWRVGVDGGGLWGTARLDLHEIRHRTETITGLNVGIHSDIDCPLCGCCIFTTGMRLDYTCTFIHNLLQENSSNLQELGILWTAGVRF